MNNCRLPLLIILHYADNVWVPVEPEYVQQHLHIASTAIAVAYPGNYEQLPVNVKAKLSLFLTN